VPLILLIGTPGAGKRPVGDYLEDEHGFVHLDLGKRAVRERVLGSHNLRDELARLAEGRRGVILTWSAGSCDQLRELRRLRAAAVELVWSDSDRGAALRAHYVDAGRVPRFRYLDTFEADGRFRPVEAVVSELLRPVPRRAPRRLRMPVPSPALRFWVGAAGAAFAAPRRWSWSSSPASAAATRPLRARLRRSPRTPFTTRRRFRARACS
jgi:hypothetical protein